MATGPALPHPDRRLPDLVADHALARPDAIAIRQWDRTVTYGQLWAGAQALAGELRSLGVRPGTLVGVCADRTPEMVAGLLGILQAGAGYVPLDPALPAARLRAIAGEAGLTLVVGDQPGAGIFHQPVPVPALVGTGGESAPCPAGADSVAYVMFTSGSTGRPKGVMIPHEGLTEFVTSLARMAGLDPTCRSLGFASIGFDASVIDLLAPLAAGGEVCLIGTADRADPVRLQRFCAEHRVTVAFLPPAILPLLDPAGLPELRAVLTGSEAPGPEQVARWTGTGRRFLNLFGPTEATVLVTWYEATGTWDRPLPIGQPAANHEVYIVDEQMSEVETGELLVGGPGLAIGYLGDEELTAQRFIEYQGRRVYRTGDLVTRLPDGNLQFLGRADRQVKVRGQRIELGEVEAVLRGHPAVGHAAVTVVAGGLVAFVTGAASVDQLRDHCAGRLPAAAVPARIVGVPELPLLSTGKVDLDHLIAHLDEPPTVDVEPLETAEEKQVAACWAEILGRTVVGRNDDFFDSGGHSITAMRLVSGVRERLRRDVSIEDVLTARTLRAIAAKAAEAEPLDGTPPVRGRPPALSPAQRRLWFLDRYSPEAAAAYNVAFAERLRGPLDIATLSEALAAVAERHEVLRWRITAVDGTPKVVLDPPGPMPVEPVDASAAEVPGRLAEAVRQPFDLATDRLWRVELLRLGPDDHVLAVIAHHAVFDGWSQALLYDDLAEAYAMAHTGRTPRLPALPATYADYVAYRADRQTRRADSDLEWWLSHLDGVPTILEIPSDRPRPAEQTFAAGYAGLWLDEPTTVDLARLASRLGATPSAVLLAALSVVLSRLTGRPDLVIGSPMVDRRQADFEPMVGFFIEIAPLRLRPNGTDSFARQVQAARDELLAALAHPEAPLERIVSAFGLSGQTERTPLVQVLFNMFNFAAPRLDLAGLASEAVPVAAPGSPFDLTVYGIERDGRLRIEAVYNADLYGEAHMTALVEAIRTVVVDGIANPDVPPELTETAVDVPRARRRVSTVETKGVTAATATERTIAAVWAEVLGLPAVGVTDSFFDVGGNSLAIVVVQQRLRRLLGRDLRVVDLFRYPTVRALASHVDGAAPGADAEVERAARRGAARRGRIKVGGRGEQRDG